MKKLDMRTIECIPGAGSNPTYPRNPNDPNVIGCNNGIIGGIIAGSVGGVPGMALGLIGGALAGGCFTH